MDAKRKQLKSFRTYETLGEVLNTVFRSSRPGEIPFTQMKTTVPVSGEVSSALLHRPATFGSPTESHSFPIVGLLLLIRFFIAAQHTVIDSRHNVGAKFPPMRLLLAIISVHRRRQGRVRRDNVLPISQW
jgi:hypothetical protein